MDDVAVLVKADLSGWSSTWERLWDAYPDLPDRLREAGVDGVEVAVSLSGDDEADRETLDRLESWATDWHDAGLHVYPHPYTDGPANPSHLDGADGTEPDRALSRMLDAAAGFARETGDPVGVTYHAGKYAGEEPPEREALLERSEAFFALADGKLAGLDEPVTVVSETQLPADREGDRIRIGDVPEEVLATVEGNPNVGICWDTGHYALAGERLDAPTPPAEEFLESVRHMHLHDVVDGSDHNPPGPGRERLAESIRRAATVGRLGSVTLEYDYGLGVADPEDAAAILAHVAETASWVRESLEG